MKLDHLTDDALRISTQNASQNERSATSVVLHHLREVSRRRLYSKWEFKDLKSYAMCELKYSEPEAWLRISAMQFLKDLPEIEAKVDSGALHLSNLVLAKRAFANEAKQKSEATPQIELQAKSGASVQSASAVKPTRTKEEKLRVLEKLENVSKREALKIIAQETGVSVKTTEFIRPLSDGNFELKAVVTEETLTTVNKVRGLLAHSKPDISYGELLGLAIDALLQELDPLRKAKAKAEKAQAKRTKILSKNRSTDFDKSTPRNQPTVPEQSHRVQPDDASLSANNKYIPAAIRRLVWARDGGRCANCESTYAVQVEHIVPTAKGGESVAGNLKLLCRSCNQRSAIEQFGLKKMGLHLRAPRAEYGWT